MKRLGWLFDRFVEAVGCLLLVALLTSVTLGIVTRAGDDPLIWTDELSRFLMVWLAGFGWIVSTRRRGHVRIRFFHDLMPSRAWRATELLVQLGMAALGAVVAWCGWYLVGRNSDLDATTLPVSMAWMYVPLISRRRGDVDAGAVGSGRAGAAAAGDSGSGHDRMISLMIWIAAGWFVAIMAGVPLFASMALAAAAFTWLSGLSVSIVPQKMAQSMNSFPLVAAPLFILMGNLLTAANITDRIVRFATSLVGPLRGGYAHASILSSMIFAGMVGSAVADAAGTGAVEIRAMKRIGYRPETAASITAAASTIGPIIPPSLPMVIYGVSADVSIGRLFLAGVIPGALMGVSLMVMVAVIARRQGFPRMAFVGLCGIWRAFRDGFFALLTPVILLGGMFSGYFTPTEAAAVASSYALLLGLVIHRSLPLRAVPQLLIDTVETTGIVAVLVMAAAALGWCMSLSRVPQTLAPAIVATLHGPLAFLLVSNVLLLFIGCFMETLAALLILIPILAPAAASFGVDPVQFGVIMIFNLILGTIHPPIGVVLFITSRIAEISYETMSRAIMPWLVPLLAVLLGITVWPPLTLWLPHVVMGK